jgi:hypothetical protein
VVIGWATYWDPLYQSALNQELNFGDALRRSFLLSIIGTTCPHRLIVSQGPLEQCYKGWWRVSPNEGRIGATTRPKNFWDL